MITHDRVFLLVLCIGFVCACSGVGSSDWSVRPESDANADGGTFFTDSSTDALDEEAPIPCAPEDLLDEDEDGFSICDGDCDDNDPARYPGAPELCNRIDDNCDSEITGEEDLDGDGIMGCQGDCDDNDPDVYPGAIDEYGDELDSDCNGEEGPDPCEAPPPYSSVPDITCEAVPIPRDFNPVIEWQRHNFSTYPDHDMAMSTPVVGNLTDDNGDGVIGPGDVPDIVSLMYGGGSINPSVVRIISGNNGALIHTIGVGPWGQPSRGNPAIADLQGDGIPEIIVPMSNSVDEVAAFEPDGSLQWKWTSSTGVRMSSPFIGSYSDWGNIYSSVAVADVDLDGRAEVLYSMNLIDADGNRVCHIAAGNPQTPVMIDIDGDGGPLEIVAGAVVYNADCTLRWDAGNYGNPAVADFDDDGRGEIVVAGFAFTNYYPGTPLPGSGLHLYDDDGTLLWSAPNPQSRLCAPTIADIDGDGQPEIVVKAGWGTPGTIRAYDPYDEDLCTPENEIDECAMWEVPITDNSGFSGSTAFDLDADGADEILTLGENGFFIIDGEGNILFYEERFQSATGFEAPVVADVDGDANAELIVPGGAFAFVLPNWNGITVIGDADDRWIYTRPVFNQARYYVNNINDDLTVPQFPESPFESHNGFTLQAPLEEVGPIAPNVSVEIVAFCGDRPGGVHVHVRVLNTGAVAVGHGLPLSLYGVDESGARRLLETRLVRDAIPAGEASDSVSFWLPAEWARAYTELVVVADDDGTGYSGQMECEEGDNELSIADFWIDENDQDDDGYQVAHDCDDSDASIYPGATEYCDFVDNDCNGIIDEDGAVGSVDHYTDHDGDGYGAGTEVIRVACIGVPGMATTPGDCNDNSAGINPEATETCDGRDNNCDGAIDEEFADTDSDGHADCVDNCAEDWNPTQSDRDGNGTGDACEGPDATDPEVEATVTPNPAEIGDDVAISVTASDNVGVTSITVNINDDELPLTAGRATWNTDTPGAYEIVATATDEMGNLDQHVVELLVIDPSDVHPPSIELEAPTDMQVVEWFENLVGTVSDDEGDLLRWRALLTPTSGGETRIAGQGNEEVIGGVIGQLDPSTFERGFYNLTVEVTDRGGNTASDSVVIELQGEAKPGAVSFSFLDIAIQLVGIPIEITRSYSSLRRGELGDFGYGWNLDIASVHVEKGLIEGEEGWSLDRCGIFCDEMVGEGDRIVTVDLGRDHQARFIFDPIFDRFSGGYITPRYRTLTVPGAVLIPLDGMYGGEIPLLWYDGSHLRDLETMEIYNPQNFQVQFANGAFMDVTTDGLELIADPSGNALSIEEDRIVHSSGRSVNIIREDGLIHAIVDPMGNSVFYEYDENRNLIEFIDREGNSTQFIYSDQFEHLVERIIDHEGREIAALDFDDSGRLSSSCDADNGCTSVTHDLGAQTQTITDRNGETTVHDYDEGGNITRIVDPTGAETSFTYDDQGNRTSITNGLGQTTRFSYDHNNNLLRRTDPMGNSWSFEYNVLGNVIRATDPDGNVETWTRDSQGRIVEYEDGSGGQSTIEWSDEGLQLSVSDLDGNAREFEYDSSGLIASTTTSHGVRSDLTYNDSNQMVREIYVSETSSGPEDVIYEYDYDSNGNLTEVVGPGYSQSIEYDGNQITAAVDAAGRRNEYSHDSQGRLTKAVLHDGSSWTLDRDAEGRVVEVTRPNGTTIKRQLDGLGRITGVTLPDGGEISRSFDAAGRLTKVVDPMGGTNRYEYNSAGKLTARINPLGHKQRFEYNRAGYVTTHIDELGRRTEFARDSKGRPLELRFPNGEISRYTYNGEGRLTSASDPTGAVKHWSYGDQGLLEETTDAEGSSWSYARATEGGVLEIVEPNGAKTSFTRDRLSRMTSRTLPLGMTETYTYENGLIASHEDFMGETTTFVRNDMGRTIERVLPDGTSHEFTYNASGQISSVSDSSGTWSYSYDDAGRTQRVTEPDGRFVEYGYDLNGRRTTLTTESGTTSYIYDRAGQITEMTDPEGRVTSYSYDRSGAIERIDHSNGASTSFAYDRYGGLSSVINRGSRGERLHSETYTRDALGRVTRVDYSNGSTVSYAYDSIGRLIVETYTPSGGDPETTTYEYDAVGNRTSVTDSAGPRTFVNDQNGRLLDDGVFTYSYDDNGNVTEREGSDETLTFTYDGLGRLVSVNREGGSGPAEIEYQYDPLGVLVARTIDGETERYLVDRNVPYHRVLEESATDGAITARNFFGPGLTSREQGADLLVYHTGWLGTVNTVTGASGAVSRRYSYDAFGNERGDSSSDTNPYRFTGERYDAALGAYDLRARQYWPQAGRFLQMDPAPPDLRESQSLHRYAYALNDPVNMRDPSGEITLVEVMAFVATIKIQMDAQTTFQTSLAALGFRAAGGMQIFDFGASISSDGQRLPWDGKLIGNPIRTSLEMNRAYYETWQVKGTKATFSVAGLSNAVHDNGFEYEFWNSAHVWECPDYTYLGGPSYAFSFSAGVFLGVSGRVGSLPIPDIGVGISGNVSLFWSMPSRISDPSSDDFGKTAQPHGYGWGAAAALDSDGTLGLSVSIPRLSFLFTYYELISVEPGE